MDIKNKINPIAIFSYFGILFIIPFLVAKEDEFVKFHIKQGITLFIAIIITSVIAIIPVIGWIIGGVASIIWLALAILGIINVLTGKITPLPLIGKYSENWKI